MPKRRAWSTVIEEHGIRVRLYERRGTIYRSVVVGKRTDSSGRTVTAKDVKSMGHGDRKRAEDDARDLARELAAARLLGRTSGPATIADLTRRFFQEEGANLSPARKRELQTMLGLWRRHLGDGFKMADFGQTQADSYIRVRQAGELRPADRRAAKSPEMGTLVNELAALGRVCNWACGFRTNGEPLLAFNPVRSVKAPKVQNRARPRAGRDRYDALVKVAGEVDPSGQFGMLLELAWSTGRRINAMCHLRVSDVLLKRPDFLRALAEDGEDEALADAWPAALRWRAEFDKMGFLTYSPAPGRLASSLGAYIRRAALVGDAWLFPAGADGAEPIKKARADYLLRKAERAAGLPRQRRGGWHAFRRGWATLRKHLPAQDVAEAGGWRDLKALQTAYTHADPATMRAVMEVEERAETA